MRVVIASDHRFVGTPDGAVWTVGGAAYEFWTRYLSVFDTVRVLARVEHADVAPDGGRRVDGDGVEVWAVPCYLGLREYLQRRSAVAWAVRDAVADDDAVILRVPSLLADQLAAVRERAGRPYAVEVVGDPYDAFGPGAIDHPLRPLLRSWGSAVLRRRCRNAAAAAYITAATLQVRYPPRPGVPHTSYSSVELPPAAFAASPRSVDPDRLPHRLVSVGSLAQPYKGIDVLLHAVARINSARRDPGLHLTHVGDGRHRPQLERLTARLGLADRVTFVGEVPGERAVREWLDQADLFVMPSRADGLPRALIEAMAWGLPAIASRVGGIPELLDQRDLVPRDDPAALAFAIESLLADPARLVATAARNHGRARDYAAEVLAPRREDFYRDVRECTIGAVPASQIAAV